MVKWCWQDKAVPAVKDDSSSAAIAHWVNIFATEAADRYHIAVNLILWTLRAIWCNGDAFTEACAFEQGFECVEAILIR